MMTEFENKTMENRAQAIYELGRIIHVIESEIFRAQGIPILDNEEHADWVQGYADRIHEIRLEAEELAGFGHRKE